MEEEKKHSEVSNLIQQPKKIIWNPYEDIADLQNNVFNSSFPVCLMWLEKKGKMLFGDHFSVFSEDHELIFKLLIYAIGNIEKYHPSKFDSEKKESC